MRLHVPPRNFSTLYCTADFSCVENSVEGVVCIVYCLGISSLHGMQLKSTVRNKCKQTSKSMKSSEVVAVHACIN